MMDDFKFQDYKQQEYKQKLLQGMKIDDYMKNNKPELVELTKDGYEAYEIFEKHLVKQKKYLKNIGIWRMMRGMMRRKTIVTVILW